MTIRHNDGHEARLNESHPGDEDVTLVFSR